MRRKPRPFKRKPIQLPSLTEPKPPLFSRYSRLLFLVIILLALSPAHTSLWWQALNGNHVNWQGLRLQLPLDWSVDPTSDPGTGEVMLERHSWFLFQRPLQSTFILKAPLPAAQRAQRLVDEPHIMESLGQHASELIAFHGDRHFHCYSQPILLSEYDGMQLHIYCEEDTTGWQIEFYGSDEGFQDGLRLVGEGQGLPVPVTPARTHKAVTASASLKPNKLH